MFGVHCFPVFGPRAYGLGLRALGLGFRVGFGFRILGSSGNAAFSAECRAAAARSKISPGCPGWCYVIFVGPTYSLEYLLGVVVVVGVTFYYTYAQRIHVIIITFIIITL